MLKSLVVAIVFCFVLVLPASAQFTSGNLIVLQAGNGTETLSSSGNTIQIQQFLTSGTNQSPVNTLTIPNTGTNRLIINGTSTTEGFLSRSSNGLFVNLVGYDGAVGGGTSSNTAAATPRGIGQIDGSGSYSRLGTSTTFYSGGNIRSIVSDGQGNHWTSGSSTGVSHWNPTPQNTVSTTVTNTREMGIANGQLYFSTASGTRGIYAVGVGLPTASGTIATNIINTGANSNPTDFEFNSSGNIAYIADETTNAATGGIQKWTFNGSTWSMASVIPVGALGIAARSLTVDWSNPTAPTIYATTTDGRLVSVLDSPDAGPVVTTLATQGTNRQFRSVDLALLPAVYTARGNGDFANRSNWSLNVDTADRNGINLRFQNVNNASNAAPTATVNNSQSNLTNVSSIVFNGLNNGYGSGTFTQYTLTGNALTLSGIASTNIGVHDGSANGFAGVYNGSGVTQTINLNLNLATIIQTFQAQNGDLVFNGNIALRSGVAAPTLIITGPANTTINGSMVDGIGGFGNFVKTGTGTLTLSNANTYSGGTFINGGKLLVTNTSGSATGTGSVQVFSTLAGNGTVAPTSGMVRLRAGATLNPGLSTSDTSSLKVNSTFQFDGGNGSKWVLDITNSGNADLLDLSGGNGNLVFSGSSLNSFLLDISAIDTLDAFTTKNYIIATKSGSGSFVGFDPSSFTFQTHGFSVSDISVSINGNNLVLTFTAVPEPGSILLISALSLGAVQWIRRRRESVGEVKLAA
jgi:autotransporter-associated beta strand protein